MKPIEIKKLDKEWTSGEIFSFQKKLLLDKIARNKRVKGINSRLEQLKHEIEEYHEKMKFVRSK